MTRSAPKCPKCKATMHQEHGAWKCLNDSEEIEDIQAKHQFYEENKDQILTDYRAGGAKGLETTWRITPSTWFSLRRRWGVDKVKAPRLPAPAAPTNGRPALPAWSDTWPEVVQLAWLGIWISISENKREEVKNRE